ncbi:unnamed protein product [Urochloa decumbens]|uniref:Thioredoxin-like protein AAED1, chloroplastic n=1 Tax=Urochloa decumbens TaxID=240449 RepID=A0ABC8WQP9_9POAL
MAARAPLAMPHAAAASAGPRPAAAPVAPRTTAPCLRARGTGGVPLLYQLPARRTHRLLLSATRPGAIGSAAEAAPAEGLVQKLQGVEVFDLSGKAVPVVDLWKDRKAVVAFARHFGCVLCQKRADLLAEKQDVMQAAGVALVLIGPGSVEQANAFVEQTKFKGEVYADPTHSSYNALEFAFGLASRLYSCTGKDTGRTGNCHLKRTPGRKVDGTKGDYLLQALVSTTSCTSTRTKKPEMTLTCRMC